MPDIDLLVSEFSARKPLLDSFGQKAHLLVEELLQAENVRVHSVTHRVKAAAKVREKLERSGKGYTCLNDLTDQVGLRIITYYEDEVDRVAAVVRGQFDIDSKNSVDKRIQEDPEKFTYSSLHYVCALNGVRASLGEYQRFAGVMIEIQIRSILQHAWAEMEHDWYDLQDRLPREIKRRFSRLAGLLDLADSEFLDIRKKKVEYERSISVRLEAKVEDMSDVSLDKVSIRSFVLQEPIVNMLDRRVAAARGLAILDTGTSEQHNSQLNLALAAGIQTLQELRVSLSQNQDAIVEYVGLSKDLWSRYTHVITPGACILHLSVLLLAQEGDAAALSALKANNILIYPHVHVQLQKARDAFSKFPSKTDRQSQSL